MRLILLITLLLTFPLAFADNGNDQCRNVNAHGIAQDYQESCEFDSTVYDFCLIKKMRGTINGTMFEYFQNDWLVLLEDLGLPTPPDAVESWYNREFAVFSSKQGMVWGEAQYVFDYRILEAGGASVPVLVTGGTGIYEDAYGWITMIVPDAYFINLSFDGRVCGPNIPND
jgi:hypothetical protein